MNRNENVSNFSISGLDKIEFLQSHENMDVYHKAYDIIEQYFGSEDDPRLGPNVQSGPQPTEQFQFTSDQSVPMDGFNFWSLPKKKTYV